MTKIATIATRIHSLKELNELKRNLERCDYIYFTTKNEVLIYLVTDNHMACLYHNNIEIFNQIGLNNRETNTLTQKIY